MTNTSEPGYLDRAMWAESSLCAFDEQVRTGDAGLGLCAVDDLYDPPADVAKDLIADICHFLNLDERAGCMSPSDIKALVISAFGMFEMEKDACAAIAEP